MFGLISSSMRCSLPRIICFPESFAFDTRRRISERISAKAGQKILARMIPVPHFAIFVVVWAGGKSGGVPG